MLAITQSPEAQAMRSAADAYDLFAEALLPAQKAITEHPAYRIEGVHYGQDTAAEIPGYLGHGATATIVDMGLLDPDHEGKIAKVYRDPFNVNDRAMVETIGMKTQVRGFAKAATIEDSALQQLVGWSESSRTVIATKVPGKTLHSASREEIREITTEQMYDFYKTLLKGIRAGISFSDRHSENTIIDHDATIGAIDFVAFDPRRAAAMRQAYYRYGPGAQRQAADALVVSGNRFSRQFGMSFFNPQAGWTESVNQIANDVPHLKEAVKRNTDTVNGQDI